MIKIYCNIILDVVTIVLKLLLLRSRRDF